MEEESNENIGFIGSSVLIGVYFEDSDEGGAAFHQEPSSKNESEFSEIISSLENISEEDAKEIMKDKTNVFISSRGENGNYIFYVKNEGDVEKRELKVKGQGDPNTVTYKLDGDTFTNVEEYKKHLKGKENLNEVNPEDVLFHQLKKKYGQNKTELLPGSGDGDSDEDPNGEGSTSTSGKGKQPKNESGKGKKPKNKSGKGSTSTSGKGGKSKKPTIPSCSSGLYYESGMPLMPIHETEYNYSELIKQYIEKLTQNEEGYKYFRKNEEKVEISSITAELEKHLSTAFRLKFLKTCDKKVTNEDCDHCFIKNDSKLNQCLCYKAGEEIKRKYNLYSFSVPAETAKTYLIVKDEEDEEIVSFSGKSQIKVKDNKFTKDETDYEIKEYTEHRQKGFHKNIEKFREIVKMIEDGEKFVYGGQKGGQGHNTQKRISISRNKKSKHYRNRSSISRNTTSNSNRCRSRKSRNRNKSRSKCRQRSSSSNRCRSRKSRNITSNKSNRSKYRRISSSKSSSKSSSNKSRSKYRRISSSNRTSSNRTSSKSSSKSNYSKSSKSKHRRSSNRKNT